MVTARRVNRYEFLFMAAPLHRRYEITGQSPASFLGDVR